jgi:hypothetical protein
MKQRKGSIILIEFYRTLHSLSVCFILLWEVLIDICLPELCIYNFG